MSIALLHNNHTSGKDKNNKPMYVFCTILKSVRIKSESKLMTIDILLVIEY